MPFATGVPHKETQMNFLVAVSFVFLSSKTLNHFGGIAADNGVVWDVFGHHRPCRDDPTNKEKGLTYTLIVPHWTETIRWNAPSLAKGGK